MKELPTLLTLAEQTNASIDRFSRKIAKRKLYYDRFYPVLLASFDEVLQEEINICVCCGLEFVGKSIGPHYKNSKQCADFKRAKEGKEPREETTKRQPLVKRENQEVRSSSGLVKLEDPVIRNDSYDELNEYFDSF